jgi:hypothetical protein
MPGSANAEVKTKHAVIRSMRSQVLKCSDAFINPG